MSSSKRMLLAFAHPDDESFGMGGSISKYVAEGADVSLICTTNGDVGTIPEHMQGQYNSVAELRLAELNCASKKLGFKHVFTFGYRDSGMMGSETSNDPACSWQVWNNNPEEMIFRVVKVIREIKPQVVVTFNRYGAYGHPDHIAIQRATVEAFHRAGDPNYETDGLPAYAPQKLYYNNIDKLMVQMGIWTTRLRGKDPRKLGVNHDIDLVEILAHVEPSHAKVNISDYLDAWQEANACHASQGGGKNGFIPSWLRRLMGEHQKFTRVYPQPSHHRIDETDLFAGVDTSR
jgi:N-acetyl-1-D-myo-inositol-2-amino-2-deoxy-alpha-D-glucopyranoside deacetylase